MYALGPMQARGAWGSWNLGDFAARVGPAQMTEKRDASVVDPVGLRGPVWVY